MFLYVWILIAADGIVASAAVHAGGRPHELGMDQLHGRIVHIAQGGHNVCKSEPLGKFRRRARRKFIIDGLAVFVRRNIHLVIIPCVTVLLGGAECPIHQLFPEWLVAGFGAYFLIIDFNPLALKGVMTVGTIQAFLQYTKNFTRPINEIAQQYSSIQTAIAGAERVFEIMDTEPESDEGTDKDFSIDNVRGDLMFKDIDFSYIPGEKVLHDFDLWIKSGQKLAIVGATGSGKTTVVNLLTRFYDIDGGSITLDGESIYDIPKKKLRGSIGIVLQDTVIFNDTIMQNIRYGRLDATDEEVIAAAKTAKVADFAEKMADGYDTMLTEGGGNLSQGQRQLIAIARAVLADPKILILDEATSSIDTRTEVHIQEAMLALMKGRTSLIIAHRLSTIRDADKIVVIDGGKVVEAGNHEKLLSENGAYARLYNTQFAGIKT